MAEQSLLKKTKELLSKNRLQPKKRLGQNFLIDRHIIHKIVDAAQLGEEDLVVEIGAGLGTMTGLLAKRAGQVLAIEIDGDLLPILEKNLEGLSNVRILQQDILQLDLDRLVAAIYPSRGQRRYQVIGNLPYYITTPIIMRLLEEKYSIEHLVIMIQKEVGQRIKAGPGSKDYGALSVAVQYYAVPEIICRVPASAFLPAPLVESVVLNLKIREQPAVLVEDEKLFFAVVRAAFGQRRKTLLNALAGCFQDISKKELACRLVEAGINGQRRGEELDLQEFSRVAGALSGLKH
ncbi:MAG: 16S rRNA (adenine(1518)-N(6)/adenine(1519)-N(6))-dimethyltransferase RsmA [Bacillota bacterium]